MWRTGIDAHLEAATHTWLPQGAAPLTLPDSVREALATVTDPSTNNLRTLVVAHLITNSLVAMATEIGTVGNSAALRPLTQLDSEWAGGLGPMDAYKLLHQVADTDGVDIVVVRALQALATVITAVTNCDDNSPDGTHMWTVLSHAAMMIRAHREQLGEDANEAALARLVKAIEQRS